jgi:hypothetical protein
LLINGADAEHCYPVAGTVALWGGVVEHEHGYRAEHAMVRRLRIPSRAVVLAPRVPRAPGYPPLDAGLYDWEGSPHPGMAASLARRYGVDVEIGPPVVWPATA